MAYPKNASFISDTSNLLSTQMYTSLAQLLKAYRARYRLTQAQAARYFDVPLRSWQAWERRFSPLSHLQRVLIAL